MVAQPNGVGAPPPAAGAPPPTLVVAGTTPGAGTTTLTAGLASALRSRGLTVQAFVTGAGEWGGGGERRADFRATATKNGAPRPAGVHA